MERVNREILPRLFKAMLKEDLVKLQMIKNSPIKEGLAEEIINVIEGTTREYLYVAVARNAKKVVDKITERI